jgi:hypothetical protein
MKRVVGFAGMLLASSAGAGQPGHLGMPRTAVTTLRAADLICETSAARHKPAPKLEVKITPPKVKIPDNSKKGTPLARIEVHWSDGAPFIGIVRITKNPGRICQLSGMELQLGRDTTKADDYKTPMCTVTAFK